LEKEYSVTIAAAPQAAIDRISRMNPRTIASRPEISITPSRIRSRSVTGIGWSGPLVLSKVLSESVFGRRPKRGADGVPGKAATTQSHAAFVTAV
jgi:hypothetical protein